MTPQAFIAELDAQNQQALAALMGRGASQKGTDEALTVPRLLALALKNELEATECAAGWIATTRELGAKLAFARQAGDEAKHYRMIEKRLIALGVDPTLHDPTRQPPSPMLTWLRSLETTVERVAAGQFTREALAIVRNDAFIRFAEAAGDEATAALYREHIQPDEKHHHELGRSLLIELATTDALQHTARQAAQKTLAIADELQEIARLKGVTHAPGC
ncbi:hypothetical protein BH09MYX1_BH09MYX1_13750 [soil metagenome]